MASLILIFLQSLYIHTMKQLLQFIVIVMESIVPKCIKNNICLNVCNVKTCKGIPFLCGDGQCLCYSQHQQCATNMRWKIMKQKFSAKLKKSSIEMHKYFIQIDDLYKNIIKQIEKSSAEIKTISDNYGLSQLEREIYYKLKQKKFTELTGQLINQVQIELMNVKKQFQVKNIEKEKKQVDNQTMILIKMLEGLTKMPIRQSQTEFKLDSKITQDVQTLSSFFFSKKIESMNLLYRASENNFQTGLFHEKCDDKQHTITILKTQFGKIIGGYTPLPWNKEKCDYQTDKSMQSFIFSLTNKNKLTLIKEKKGENAIHHNPNYGPVFGGGIDIYISPKANQNNSSFARPGDTYNYNNEYIYDTQQSYQKFSGRSDGFNFKIEEWQVYQIVFFR